MPHHAELPEETIADRPSPANDPNVINLHEPAREFVADPGPVRPPQRFGRLALWMASATALGIGVLGTVAYGMWFNHDQRVYAEAMSSARKTLGMDQPAIAAQTQSSGAVEAPTADAPGYVNANAPADVPPPVDTPALADNTPAVVAEETTVADATDPPATDAADAAIQATASGQSAPQAAAPAQTAAVQRRAGPSSTQVAANRAAVPVRRHEVRVAAKPEGGLFARMGAFFHRVSYRHNATRQREEYSRP